MNSTALKQHISPAATGPAGGSVRVFRRLGRIGRKPTIAVSQQTLRTFAMISDPANARIFSKEAALKWFDPILLPSGQ